MDEYKLLVNTASSVNFLVSQLHVDVAAPGLLFRFPLHPPLEHLVYIVYIMCVHCTLCVYCVYIVCIMCVYCVYKNKLKNKL